MKCWKSWGVKGVGGARVVEDTDGRNISALLDFIVPASAKVKFNGERWAAEDFRTPAYRELRLWADLECLIELPAPLFCMRLFGEREDIEVDAARDRVLEVPIAAGRGRLRRAARSSSLPGSFHDTDPARLDGCDNPAVEPVVQIPIPLKEVVSASEDSRRSIEISEVCIGTEYCILYPRPASGPM